MILFIKAHPAVGTNKRPLYVRRKVLNAADLIEWAKSQGFKKTLKPDDLHVTQVYSKEPVDWHAAGDSFDRVKVAGGKRVVAPLGDAGAVVLKIESGDLSQRWQQFRDAGASWDYESYQPHVTISYDGAGMDLSKVEPYAGPIEFGPEVYEPLDDEWQKKVEEKPTMAKSTAAPVVFLKSHIDTYTKKDGTVVAAHEDKRPKHSPEQMAKWAAEKKARESAQAAQHAKDSDTEKQIRQRRADGVTGTSFGSAFNDAEIRDIQGYYLSGDRAGALAEGRNAAVSAIERKLRSSGIEIEHVSESQGGKSKSLYVKIGGQVVRVSDHELPMTPERETNRSRGLTGRWDREVVVSDWQATSLEDYIGEIKGAEMAKAAAPVVLFLKAAKPESTSDLIAEHEHLVDVLNSPSHEDDEEEAEKQAKELAEYKREAKARG